MKISMRILCLMLSVFMALSMSACGGKSDSDTKGNSSGGSNLSAGGYKTWDEIKSAIPSDAKGKTIQVYSWNKITDVTGAADAVKKFTEETGINVDWVVGNYDEYTTKIAGMVSSQQSPDIVRLKDIDTGLLQVLQPLQGINYDFTDEAWDTRVMDFYTFDGKTYATNMRNTLLQQPAALIYNKNLISKCDLEDPYSLWKQGNWNFDKFVEICEEFTEVMSDDNTYLAWTSCQWSDITSIYGSGMIKREGDRFVSNMSDENLLKGWQKMCQLRVDGVTNNLRFDLNNFENGKILFFTESLIGVRRTHHYFSNLKSQGALGAVPLPKVDSNDAVVWGEVEAYGIPEGAPNADLVPYFLRYYLDSDNYEKNTFFCDKTMLDVHEELMKAEKIYQNYDCSLITDDVGKAGIHINASILNKAPAQVKSALDSNASLVEAAVKSTNNILDKIKDK